MDEKQREKKEKLKLQIQFGDYLKDFRTKKGLTSAELARRCFMERSSMARMEKGRINPSLFALKKLATGMEIEIGEFLKDFK